MFRNVGNKLTRRQRSQSLVLRLLRDLGPTSRADLARLSGLSTTSMTHVVGALLDAGWVTEGPAGGGEPRVGRPPVEVALVPERFAVCGVQVGVGSVRVGVTDLLARVSHRDGFDFDIAEPPSVAIAALAEQIRRLVTDGGIGGRLLAAGVAVPSTVDIDQRRTVMSLNLGWSDVDVAGPLEDALGVPVIIDHNVRSMALAEARYGGGRDTEHLAYVYLRTGIGAGLVMNGEPFRGGVHGGSELGHLKVVEKGRACVCGATGCLETVLSGQRLAEQVAGAAALDPEGALAHASAQTDNSLAALGIAADAGDAAADELLSEAIDHLAPALASLVNLLNPELIVLGGLFAEAPDTTFDRVREALRAHAFPVLRDAVRVERTALGPDAGIYGGAAIALDRYFYRPDVARP
jgi:predicted NBD/HSP70 family sugar kinase